MPKNTKQKLKVLYILQTLMRESDESHPVSTKHLVEVLAANGITAERKGIYRDIEALQLFGFEIAQARGRTSGYYLLDRDFNLPELKLLVDSVQSSRFITERKTKDLIRKIESLASVYNAQLLERQVYVSGRVKSMNESVYYNVDAISDAILGDKQVTFRYFEYGADKQRHYKREKGGYKVSPFALMWNHENYYLIAYDEAAGIIKHYRVDKMSSIDTVDEKRLGRDVFERIDLSDYGNSVFGMFGGERQQVQLRFSNSLAGVAIDRFGRDAAFVPDGDDHFTVWVDVVVSEQFYGWLMGLGTDVELLQPACARDGFKAQLQRISAQYGG